jgi:hypothetical protein
MKKIKGYLSFWVFSFILCVCFSLAGVAFGAGQYHHYYSDQPEFDMATYGQIEIQTEALEADLEYLLEGFEGMFLPLPGWGSIPDGWWAGGSGEFSQGIDAHHGVFCLHAQVTYDPQGLALLLGKTFLGEPGIMVTLSIQIKGSTTGQGWAGLGVLTETGFRAVDDIWSVDSPPDWRTLILDNAEVLPDGTLTIFIRVFHDSISGSSAFDLDCLTFDGKLLYPPTYDATGTWTYSTTNNWAYPGCERSDETGTATVTQIGNNVEAVIDGITYTGTVNGTTYTLSASYPEDGGTASDTIVCTFLSKNFGSGRFTWSWTDGVSICYGGSDFYVTKGALLLILIAPNGGEVIPSGSSYTIEWVATLEAVSFKLKYSLDNGNTWQLLAQDVTGNSYDWPVPAPKKNKTKCLVKVIGYDGSDKKVGADKSDSTFTIEVVKVTWPNGGETLTSGDIPTITWITHETKKDVARVILKYTQNGGRAWNKIATLDGNPGSYNEWTVPDVPKTKGKCLVKVVLKDAKGNTVGSDTSDGYFTIQP